MGYHLIEWLARHAGPFRPLFRLIRGLLKRVGRLGKKFALAVGYSTFVLFNSFLTGLPQFIRRIRTEPLRDLKFANAMRSRIPLNTALLWNLFNKVDLVFYLDLEHSQGNTEELVGLITESRKSLQNIKIILSSAHEDLLAAFRSHNIETTVLSRGMSLQLLISELFIFSSQADLVIINPSKSLPQAEDLILLKYATHKFHRNLPLGGSTIGAMVGDRVIAGYDFSRSESSWVPVINSVTDFGQSHIPRRSLVATHHLSYFSNSALRSAQLASGSEKLSFENQINLFVMNLVQSGRPLLTVPQIALPVEEVNTPELLPSQLSWLTHRNVTNVDGKTHIIFVLPATSISGGIRVVLQIASKLSELGNLVEIWALEGQPNWIDIPIEVRKFENYSDMVCALSVTEAIKVATWWETDAVVWDGSVNKGIPVNFIQEFETWFFPENPRIQAAVVASYRHEFHYIATGGYQQKELSDQGINSHLIPVGYDSEIFKLRNIARDTNTVLALGRSFFQKNFKLTLAAWRSMPSPKPRLQLFGIEPKIATDPGISYRYRPSDEEIAELYNSATVFVQTSYHEGFSLPIIEAMASGCPVITTNSHGNMDFCVPEENCLLVSHEDPNELAEKIKTLVSDPTLQQRLSKAGIETAQRYTWAQLIPRYNAFFNKLVELHSGGKIS